MVTRFTPFATLPFETIAKCASSKSDAGASTDILWAETVFRGRAGGFYVDLASNDPRLLSNSHAFDRIYNWSGLCIEPQRQYYAGYVRHRTCTLAQLLVGKGELVHSRLVATDARGPVVSKTFDVDAAPGARAHKKITYTNPYARPRTFHLRCTHPLLLHFRPDRLDLPAGGSRPMGLTFEPAEDWERATRGAGGVRGGPAEVLVFINDEDDATEECFRIRVNADPR